MWFFFSLIPATLGVVLGYLILFSSTKTHGGVETFGRILAIWVFILAGLVPVAGAYATFAGLAPIGAMMQRMESMHSGMSPQDQVRRQTMVEDAT
jgi:hypothetical protein